MNIIYAEYNIHHNSIYISAAAGYLLKIDCWEAETDLKTTPCSECALNTPAADAIHLYVKKDQVKAPFFRNQLIDCIFEM